MSSILILNARMVNEGKIVEQDVFINKGRIERMSGDLAHLKATHVIDATGKHLLPGVIDDQVHFREPGLTHKATIATESRAAVAGGTTTFMEMPNTVPNTLTQQLLAEKYAIAAGSSLANYSFFMGVSNDNIEEVLRTNPRNVCGVKIFMGSSTGNMLVDNPQTLETIFSQCPLLIATHCEDETTIRAQSATYRQKYGDNVPMHCHPEIRSIEACYKSSSLAIELAKKHHTRLHILHISTAEETALFNNSLPLAQKHITSEACVHHLWFDAAQYHTLGAQIKCNPAIKEARHKDAILQAVLDNRIDIIATDHAPHTWEEKSQNYWKAPSGLPLVQHSLQMMLDFVSQGKLTLERMVEKMSHAPAICFQIEERGFIREGYWADLVLVDLNRPYTVNKANILYKCGWSPLEGHTFSSTITHTIVSGHLAFANGILNDSKLGERILFTRNV
ncbi:MAG: dihydroorotase [Cytophagales bacterium]|nr:dihydroorotase [Bernardetiaceae bacterium]MDW8203886.1 dihydroorotase [Cytophagales bacterium]